MQKIVSVFLLVAWGWLGHPTFVEAQDGKKPFRAGAAEVDITPLKFPVIVNGMFQERQATMAHARLTARALVLDDGQTRLAIVVVDNLMIPRRLLDQAKEMAREATGIPVDRMLISATHNHSAPSAMGCLGSRSDPDYEQFLPGQIAKSIAQAAERLVPARIGWTVVQDHEHNHCRRWIFRPDRIQTDPFGQRTVRAHMHPGHQSPNHIGPSGPADPDLTLLAVQTRDGRPLAVLANYAMHYYGSPLVSSDFCGQFGEKFASLIGATEQEPPFVGMMSQGTSGDSMWPDYSQPPKQAGLDAYTEAVARIARDAYAKIEYRDDLTLAMAETTLKLRRRVPDEERLKRSREIVASLGDRQPTSMAEIYAREQIYLHEEPEVELKLQAIRIGDLGITAIPNEVYGITGLKLKARSPLQLTFNIELANGAEGYIPTPEQHYLGGYTTWPARTAGLEVEAEPKIVAALLELLEQVSGTPRRAFVDPSSEYSEAVLASKPAAYWRLGEIDGTQAADATGRHHARYEMGVAYYLPGADSPGLTSGPRGNRAAHFAGGRVHAQLPSLGDKYTVSAWIWNGLPHDARAVTGYFFSRGPEGDRQAPGDHLGIGGTYQAEWQGKLIFFNGNERNEVLAGRTVLPLKTWSHVTLTRNGDQVAVYLNGQQEPEIVGKIAITYPKEGNDLWIGGRSDGLYNWEGKLDEVAVFDRVLTTEEIIALYKAGRMAAPKEAATATTREDGQSSSEPNPPPRSPEQSLKMLHVREGYQAELVASEPLTMDPVAIDWGPDGKLWVAEMADYPLGLDGRGKPGGRIRFLEDLDGDGRYDKSTVFLDGVNFPTGVMAWERGVLVTAAPEIFYAEDTNGDGRADRRETLFVGFLEGNQQLRVNGLRWGLDNWVYCASGSHHGGYGAQSKIRSTRAGAEIYVGSRDFRIQPKLGLLDPLAGPSQFGRERNDWGDWFGVQNSHPVWHYVLEDRYTRRNPHIAPPDPKRHLLPTNPPVYPAKSPEKRFHSFEQSGRFTSACSVLIYRDELLWQRNDGQIEHVLTCEPFHNLVQHNLLTVDGVSYRAQRDAGPGERDFIASEDHWFRPVMVRTGPDGALWVVDMYRYMIEHPEWLPPAGKEELRPFYRSGDDRGRIYRVFPKNRRPRAVPRLDTMDTAQLVATLASPNGWQRDTAQRLLVEQQDASAVPALERMARTHDNPLARLHALATLDGLGKLDWNLLKNALADPYPGVRRHALRCAETVNEIPSDLVGSILALRDDPHAGVRLQLACSLGQWKDSRIGATLADLALASPEDTYLRAAVLSSVNGDNIGEVLGRILSRVQETSSAESLLHQLLPMAAALDDGQAISQAVEMLHRAYERQPNGWQFTALAGILDGFARRRPPIDPKLPAATQERVVALQAAARATLADSDANPPLRAAAAKLLLRQASHRAADLDQIRRLLVPQTSAEVQMAIVTRVAEDGDPRLAELLLDGWRSHSPTLRNHILTAIASRPAWVVALADQLEAGKVASSEIDAAMRQRLLATKDATLRQRLESAFAQASGANRAEVIAQYRTALELPADAGRGAIVFQKKCATCHKQGDVGHEVGPNLASITSKTPAGLLEAILDPSRAVEAKYLNYVAVTQDGRSYSGILATETGSSLTLLAPEGQRYVLLRSELEQFQSTGRSLMPDGLEKELSPQEVADVIAFIIETSGK